MADIGERVATCEERLRGLEVDVKDLMTDARKTRHALRTVEGVLALRSRMGEEAARRERRLFAIGGLVLTAINVAVAVLAVTQGSA